VESALTRNEVLHAAPEFLCDVRHGETEQNWIDEPDAMDVRQSLATHGVLA